MSKEDYKSSIIDMIGKTENKRYLIAIYTYLKTLLG